MGGAPPHPPEQAPVPPQPAASPPPPPSSAPLNGTEVPLAGPGGGGSIRGGASSDALPPEFFTSVVQGVLSSMMGSLSAQQGSTESIADFIQRLSGTSNIFEPGTEGALGKTCQTWLMPVRGWLFPACPLIAGSPGPLSTPSVANLFLEWGRWFTLQAKCLSARSPSAPLPWFPVAQLFGPISPPWSSASAGGCLALSLLALQMVVEVARVTTVVPGWLQPFPGPLGSAGGPDQKD